ncbi:restriction endonuclease [Streptomyces sp. NPDC126522]|uniref:restriction endonuclease n=1 Tax=Streptomyces sp. NPDC126522 TaxID=3155211 RepID=UPI00332A60FF
MGYDTFLEIGGKHTFMWRKHASELPRMLFRFDQLHVEYIGDQKYARGQFSVIFRGTVRDSLEVLADSGLGWNAAVSAYAATRVDQGQAAGAFIGNGVSDGLPWEEVLRREEEFVKGSAEDDLLHLGQLMVEQINDDSDEVVILDDLNDSESLPNPGNAAFKAYTEAIKYGIDGKFKLMRAVESLSFLQRDAPLLAWPLAVCVFLKSLPPDVVMELDLSDDAAEFSMADTEQQARSYAANYWENSSRELARTAQSLGRLFGVLSSFDGALSEEFWFARSSELMRRLRDLNQESIVHTKARGDALEGLVEALLRTEGAELTVVEKNFRTAEEEIDILASNGLKDPFWVSQGSPLVLIECKNWKTKVGVPELRIFESKLRDRGALCKIGIFVSLSGFRKTFLERLKSFQETGGIIFAVDGHDIEEMIANKQKMTEWLRSTGLRKALGR